MMLQHSLTLVGPKQLEWKSKVLPPIEEDEVLIRTIAGAISIGAELPQYSETDVTDPNPSYPRETGYESYGKVVEIGREVWGLKVGDHVIATYGHKDYSIEKGHNVVKVPESINYTYALLNTLSCDAGKGVLKLNPEPKDRVLVAGAGTMGLLTIHFLKNYVGVEQVDVIDPILRRGEVAEVLGAKYILKESSTVYDFGIECSSSKAGFDALLRAMKRNGDICVLSDGNKDLLYLNEDFYEKELRIVGSSDGWDYHKHARWFFDCYKKTPQLQDIFQHEIKSNELIDCFEELSQHTINPLKVLVRYEE